MNTVKKILGLLAAVFGAGILPAITNATCSTTPADCFPMPSFASFLTASGDWIAGMFDMVQTPLLWGIGWMVIAGVIGFIVFLVSRAVSTLMGN